MWMTYLMMMIFQTSVPLALSNLKKKSIKYGQNYIYTFQYLKSLMKSPTFLHLLDSKWSIVLNVDIWKLETGASLL